MIRLELTIPQADWLQQHLLDHAQAADDQPTILLAQLVQAYERATASQTCPVCQRTFTQMRCGRTGIYCSSACKQKAYRERVNGWRRQLPAHVFSDYGPDDLS